MLPYFATDLQSRYPQILLKDLWKSLGHARYLSDQTGFIRVAMQRQARLHTSRSSTPSRSGTTDCEVLLASSHRVSFNSAFRRRLTDKRQGGLNEDGRFAEDRARNC
ncbi:hypothetical protein PSAB6_10264 [Paraburkholderia sabiae]|nr:hypothetical protein PSAB6_10264 [Paraburkholderia sabiae]